MITTVRRQEAQPAGAERTSGGCASREEGAPARPLSAHTTDGRTAREVVFYRLGEKFVDHERSIPDDVRLVLYYTLAIGHHTGVIDCLHPRLSTSRDVFADALALMDPGSARDKLAGIERFGEIEVRGEHVALLKPAVIAALERSGAALADLGKASEEFAASASVVAADALSWLEEFLRLLEEIQCEACVYAMGRRVS